MRCENALRFFKTLYIYWVITISFPHLPHFMGKKMLRVRHRVNLLHKKTCTWSDTASQIGPKREENTRAFFSLQHIRLIYWKIRKKRKLSKMEYLQKVGVRAFGRGPWWTRAVFNTKNQQIKETTRPTSVSSSSSSSSSVSLSLLALIHRCGPYLQCGLHSHWMAASLEETGCERKTKRIRLNNIKKKLLVDDSVEVVIMPLCFFGFSTRTFICIIPFLSLRVVISGFLRGFAVSNCGKACVLISFCISSWFFFQFDW